MPEPLLTFCIGVKDWMPEHLDRCLASLRHFPTLYPIAIADLSCSQQAQFDVQVLTTNYRAIYRWFDRPRWSRSFALNRAAELAKTPYLVFTDADMIFPPGWITALERIRQARALRQPTLFLTRSRDLAPDDAVVYDVMFGSFFSEDEDREAWLTKHSTPHPDVGQGAATVVSLAWFEEVGGFDEVYETWGCEDNDLVLRAEWSGLHVEWFTDLYVAHQYHSHGVGHPLMPTQAEVPAVVAQVQRNREYLAARIAERGPIKRNVNPGGAL